MRRRRDKKTRLRDMISKLKLKNDNAEPRLIH